MVKKLRWLVTTDFFPKHRKSWYTAVCATLWLAAVICSSLHEWNGIIDAIAGIQLLVHVEFLGLVATGLLAMSWAEAAFKRSETKNAPGEKADDLN